MGRRVYVGNLGYSVNSDDLKQFFTGIGSVKYARVMADAAGNSRGFGFVEFLSEDDAQKAVSTMHRADFKGRSIIVDIAKERTPVVR